MLNLAFCCQESFHSNAVSPSETPKHQVSASMFSVPTRSYNSTRQSNISSPLFGRWQSMEGGNKYIFFSSYFVKMSWKAFNLVIFYYSITVFLCRRNHLSIDLVRNIVAPFRNIAPFFEKSSGLYFSVSVEQWLYFDLVPSFQACAKRPSLPTFSLQHKSRQN